MNSLAFVQQIFLRTVRAMQVSNKQSGGTSAHLACDGPLWCITEECCLLLFLLLRFTFSNENCGGWNISLIYNLKIEKNTKTFQIYIVEWLFLIGKIQYFTHWYERLVFHTLVCNFDFFIPVCENFTRNSFLLQAIAEYFHTLGWRNQNSILMSWHIACFPRTTFIPWSNHLNIQNLSSPNLN